MKKILEGHYLSCLQTNYWGTCLLCPPVSAPEDSAQYYIFCERLTTRPVTFTLASIPHCQCQLCKILFCRRRDKRSNNEKISFDGRDDMRLHLCSETVAAHNPSKASYIFEELLCGSSSRIVRLLSSSSLFRKKVHK